MNDNGTRRCSICSVLKSRFVIWLAIVAVAAFVFFGFMCIPFRVKGDGMDPAYRDGQFNFCWAPRYAFSEPRRSEVVAVKIPGREAVYLKRVVAVEGDTFAFLNGKLMLNGKPAEEPYVHHPCDWTSPPIVVSEGYFCMVGDNRDEPLEQHLILLTRHDHILGAPLW